MREFAAIMKVLIFKGRWILISLSILYFSRTLWSYSRTQYWSAMEEAFLSKNYNNGKWTTSLTSLEIPSLSEQAPITLMVNMTAMIHRVKDRNECKHVAADPRSYWRSQNANGSLNTSATDTERMTIALRCGILYEDYFAKSPIPTLYPFERFYLSEPPLVDIDTVSNETLSVITIINASLEFKVGETVAFRIEMKDSRGHSKLKGGDTLRVWLDDASTKSKMAAKVVDLNNGTYIASAPLLWVGKLRLIAAIAYPREYHTAHLYTQQVLKSFRHIAGVFTTVMASEATPCYHTQVIPGYGPSEQCNLTDVNGSPWFCGHPDKPQLKCSDYVGSTVISEQMNYPVTDAEMEIFRRSCREPRIRRIPNTFELSVSQGITSSKMPCNEVSPQKTWTQEIPNLYMHQNIWYSRLCNVTNVNYTQCFKNKQVMIFGDSNGRSHYHLIVRHSNCWEIKKAPKKRWHKPLLCVNTNNNFSVSWSPHTNPFMSDFQPTVAFLGSLIPTSKAIDDIPSHGEYLIILNHYYHLTTTHISVIDLAFRSIKDALVRLFKRNANVQVVLQGPHIAWFGWSEHYAAGDMQGVAIMQLQHEIFHDIQDKVVYVSPWDMTIAAVNYDYHLPADIFYIITGFVCGR